jgi:dolichol-phosphate mannosyltransferase
MRTLGIVVPTYNEAENIKDLIIKIKDSLKSTDIFTRVLVVDDNSPDGTGKIVDDLKGRINSEKFQLDCLHRAKKNGLGGAYKEGMKNQLEYGADFIQQMDADFSHDPIYLPILLKEVESHDLVIGSRYVKGGKILNWNIYRKILSRLGNIFAKCILWIPVNDITGGFNLYRREVLEKIGLESIKTPGYGFLLELKYQTCNNGFRIGETPVIFKDREKGASKISKKYIIEALLLTIKLRLGKHI